jgi:hypothetical protein
MTAVEWLVDQLTSIGVLEIPQGSNAVTLIIEQAKKMEKQQIIDAHGNQTKKSGGISNATYILTGEQYYNETFN